MQTRQRNKETDPTLKKYNAAIKALAETQPRRSSEQVQLEKEQKVAQKKAHIAKVQADTEEIADLEVKIKNRQRKQARAADHPLDREQLEAIGERVRAAKESASQSKAKKAKLTEGKRVFSQRQTSLHRLEVMKCC